MGGGGGGGGGTGSSSPPPPLRKQGELSSLILPNAHAIILLITRMD